MKPLHFDAINPFTGTPFLWGDPNLRFVNDVGVYLEPGDEGFVPYPGQVLPEVKKKKKPFRRTPRQKTETIDPSYTIMSTFKYNVAPNSQGGFTTRAVLADPIGDVAFFDLVAARSGKPSADCIAVFDAIVDTVADCAAGCAHSTSLRDRLRFRPTSGGSQAASSGFNTPDELNADVAISLTAVKRDAWRAGLTLESQGEVGKLSPEIDSIVSQENGAQDKYAPGTMIELSGFNLRFTKSDLTQGVFFRSGNNPEVRATVYGTVTPTSLSVLVPATLSGPLTVRSAAFINGSVRSFTYMTAITQ